MVDLVGPRAFYTSTGITVALMILLALPCQVLSLGFLMTSYLKWCGLTEAEVSIYRGVGAITGLMATFVYPTLRKQMGEN